MRGADLILACVLSLLHGRHPAEERCRTPYVREIASAIRESAAEFDVDGDVVAAVARHESGFKQFAIGRFGEVGLMQLKRGGALQGRDQRLPNRVLFGVRLNIRLGTKYLSTFAHRCERPVRYLTPYNGGHCVPSHYSRSIMKELHAVERSFAIDQSTT